MKKYLAILLVFVFCAFSQAQDKKEDQACQESFGQFSLECGECGCPGSTPSRWDVIYGTAVSIVDSDTIVVNFDNKNYTINLIGIDTDSNQTEITLFLQKTILNKRVNVFVRAETGENLQNSGIIVPIEKEIRSINEYLLQNGMAKYKAIDLDALDDAGVTACEFKLSEKKAKEARSGIWAK